MPMELRNSKAFAESMGEMFKNLFHPEIEGAYHPTVEKPILETVRQAEARGLSDLDLADAVKARRQKIRDQITTEATQSGRSFAPEEVEAQANERLSGVFRDNIANGRPFLDGFELPDKTVQMDLAGITGGEPPPSGPPAPPSPPESWYKPEDMGETGAETQNLGLFKRTTQRVGTHYGAGGESFPKSLKKLMTVADVIEHGTMSGVKKQLEAQRDRGRPSIEEVDAAYASKDPARITEIDHKMRVGGLKTTIERNRIQLHDQLEKVNLPVLEKLRTQAETLKKEQKAREDSIQAELGEDANVEIMRGLKHGDAPTDILKPFHDGYKNGLITQKTMGDIQDLVYRDYAFGRSHKAMMEALLGVKLPEYYSHRALKETKEGKLFYEDMEKLADEVDLKSSSDPLATRKRAEITGKEDQYFGVSDSYQHFAEKVEKLFFDSPEVKRQTAYAMAVPEMAHEMPAFQKGHLDRLAEKMDEAGGDIVLAKKLIDNENEAIHRKVVSKLEMDAINESVPEQAERNAARVAMVLEHLKNPAPQGPVSKTLSSANQVLLSTSLPTIVTSSIGDSVNSIRDYGFKHTIEGMSKAFEGTPFRDAWHDSVTKSQEAVKLNFAKNPAQAAKAYGRFLFNLVNAPRNMAETFNRRATYEAAEAALRDMDVPSARMAIEILGPKIGGEVAAEIAGRAFLRSEIKAIKEYLSNPERAEANINRRMNALGEPSASNMAESVALVRQAERLDMMKKDGPKLIKQMEDELKYHSGALRQALDFVASQSRPTGALSETILQSKLKTGKKGQLNIKPVLMNQSYFLLGLAKMLRMVTGQSELKMTNEEKIKYAGLAFGLMAGFGTSMNAVMRPLTSNSPDKRKDGSSADEVIGAISYGVGLNPYLFAGSFGHDPFSIQSIPSNVARVFTPAPLNKAATLGQDLLNMAVPKSKFRVAASGNIIKRPDEKPRPVPKIFGDITNFAPAAVNIYGMTMGEPTTSKGSSTRYGMQKQRQMMGLTP